MQPRTFRQSLSIFILRQKLSFYIWRDEMVARIHGHRYYHFEAQYENPEMDAMTSRCLPAGSHVHYAQYNILQYECRDAHICKVSDWRGRHLVTVFRGELPTNSGVSLH